jgi:hypothetical protein
MPGGCGYDTYPHVVLKPPSPFQQANTLLNQVIIQRAIKLPANEAAGQL